MKIRPQEICCEITTYLHDRDRSQAPSKIDVIDGEDGLERYKTRRRQAKSMDGKGCVEQDERCEKCSPRCPKTEKRSNGLEETKRQTAGRVIEIFPHGEWLVEAGTTEKCPGDVKNKMNRSAETKRWSAECIVEVIPHGKYLSKSVHDQGMLGINMIVGTAVRQECI